MSDWLDAVTMDDRKRVESHIQAFLSKLFGELVKEWEAMVYDELSSSSSFAATGPERGTSPGVMNSLVLNLGHSNREVRTHAITTLVSRQTRILADGTDVFDYSCFTDESIESMAKMAVDEDDDDRTNPDALKLLEDIATNDKTKARRVESALVRSCQSGLNLEGEPEQQMRTIKFVGSVKNHPKGPFHSLIDQLMPDLVGVALRASEKDVRRAAMNLTSVTWKPSKQPTGAESVPQPKDDTWKDVFHSAMENSDGEEQYRILKNLSEALKEGQSENPGLEMTWGSQAFLHDVTAVLAEEVVHVAIFDPDPSVSREAIRLLRQLTQGDFQFDMLKILGRVESYQTPPDMFWGIRDNFVLVFKMLKHQLHPSGKLLQDLLTWAESAEDQTDKSIQEHVRRLSLKLISCICESKKLEDGMVDVLKTALASKKDSIVALCKSDGSRRTDWVIFLGILIKFPALVSDAVQIALELVTIHADESDFDILDCVNPESNLKLGECPKRTSINVLRQICMIENGPEPEYTQAVKRLLMDRLTPDISLQDPDQLAKVSGLVKFSIALSLTESLRKTAEDFLRAVAKVLMDDIRPKKSDDTATPGSQLKAHKEPIGWIYLVATLAAGGYFPEDLKGVAASIFAIVDTEDDDRVRYACLRSLQLLARSKLCKYHYMNTAARMLQLKDIANKMEIFLDETKNPSDVRILFVQLLLTLGRQSECEIQNECERHSSLLVGILRRLATLAVSDRDKEVCLDALNVFSGLAYNNTIEAAQESVNSAIVDKFESGMKVSDWRIRQAWVKFASTQIKDANSKFLSVLLDNLIIDTQSEVREEIAKAFRSFMDSKAEARDSVASKLSEVLSPSLASPTPGVADRAVSILVAITRPRSESDFYRDASENILCQRRDAVWIELILLFGRIPAYESLLHKVINTAIKESGEIRDLDPFSKIDDEKTVSRLAGLAIKADDDPRQHALQLLEAFVTKGRLEHLQRPLKASLQKVVENSLKDHESHSLRANALKVIDRLTKKNAQFRDFVRPSISHLLKAVLTDGDPTFYKQAKKVLFENLAHSNESEFNHVVLVAVPSLIAKITTNAGKRTALRLTQDFPISDNAALSIADKLSRILQHTSPFERATALEMLLRLYEKHGRSKPSMVDSSITKIVALALDDRNSDIWEPAMRLLIALSSPPKADKGKSLPVETTTYKDVLSRIKAQLTKFMGLLDPKDKRSLAVELLSSVSRDAAIRQSISLRIVSKIFATGTTKLQEGQSELLGRLISDGRFEDEATDYMMLFVSHTLAPTNPDYSQYRREILTSLWSCYGMKTLRNKDSIDKLGKWFRLALFGRRATPSEVAAWNEGCESWLKDEKESESLTGDP
ncbi:hypothetical protein H1R20_g9066, partial [Candolleomyces eurysporus]